MVPTADGRNASYPFANLVPQDGSGKAFERTPDQVHPSVHRLQYIRIVSVSYVHVLHAEGLVHACCCSSAQLGTATHRYAMVRAAGSMPCMRMLQTRCAFACGGPTVRLLDAPVHAPWPRYQGNVRVGHGVCRCWQLCTEGTPHSRAPSTPKA